MARYAYERLSAQDATFLWAESPREPMHVAAVAILESGPLRNEDGGIDIERYRRSVEAVLHWIPRYRQKIAWTPIEGWPVWYDDRHFDLAYHVRHIALPKPGTLGQLKEITSRVLARPLDRERPLWEIWVVEGLEGGEQFALINKIHHCMIDGAAGADLSQILLSPSSDAEVRAPVPYYPRPKPNRRELLMDALVHRAQQPLSLLAKARELLEDPEEALDDLRRRASAFSDLLDYSIEPASETPINGKLSPHRRFDWLTMPMGDLLDMRKQLGCTVNDVVLATVAGALRRYLFRHRLDLSETSFRVATPVSTRKKEHARAQGNHVSTWIIPMPLAEADPMARLEAIREATADRKKTESSLAIETMMEVFEFLPPALLARSSSLVQGPINMMVTNVPGPNFPLYQVGAKLLGMYPMVPLVPGSGLGIALFSYEGKLCWGINADYQLVPDVDALAADLRDSFEELRSATVTAYLKERTAAPERPPEGKKAKAAGKKKKRKKAAPRRSGKKRAARPKRTEAPPKEAPPAVAAAPPAEAPKIVPVETPGPENETEVVSVH